MTQKPSDLLNALKEKGVKRIKAPDIASAINVIEARMGPCWKKAYGSRHVAHKMLRNEFVPFHRRTSSLTKEPVPKKYKLKEGEKIVMVVAGYRPLTVKERNERELKLQDKRAHSGRSGLKRAAHVERRRERREAAIARRRTLVPEEQVSFSGFLTPQMIRKLGIGNLSVG